MNLVRLLRQQQYQDHDQRRAEFRLTSQPQSTLKLDPQAVRASLRGCVVVDGCIVKVVAR